MIALDFADASPEFWIGLQTSMNLWEASQKRIKKPKFRFPKARRTPGKTTLEA